MADHQGWVTNCPFCGTSLEQTLSDGLACCEKCGRVFDSSRKHRLLSAFLLLRRLKNCDEARLRSLTGLSDVDLAIVFGAIEDELSYDEFLVVLTEMKIESVP